MEIDFLAEYGANHTSREVKLAKRLAVDAVLLSLALASLSDGPLREKVEGSAEEIIASLCVTNKTIAKVIFEVAGDLNLRFSDEDRQLIARRLIEVHLKNDYLEERIKDHLGEQIEETISELRFSTLR